ncbi:MAG: hypothetical protein JWP27_1069 [Flaviaesturariibacter sp.]|nr:hypothetical protein [Flaviaesturariibacter sp.]
MNRFTVFLALAILLLSCEKTIHLELETVPPKIVVEGTIENGGHPLVILTRSQAYFARITPQQLAASFVHGATVTIATGARVDTLKEYAVPLAPGFSLSYYTSDSARLASAITGQLQTSYALRIESEGSVYTATTTIPGYHKRLDSIWYQPVTGDTSGRQVLVYVRAADAPGFGDYVRYWTKRNREPYLPGFTSVYDDLVIDGTTYNLAVEPGIDRNSDDNSFASRAFKKGDTVTLKLSGIDKATYDFWRTMEYTYASIGNPFSTPVRVLSNVSGGALGYFGGYASQYRSIIIPR